MSSRSNVRLENILGPILVFVLVFAVFSIYAPGRYGGFLLDDYVNIGPMSQVEQGFDGFVRYIFSGAYGSPDRWLSKLSFLIDSPSWPSDAFRFKQNNILLHVLNGVLVIWVFLSLMRLMGHSERMSQAVALILGALWLLHPLNVSTALYVVQRMTELSALFVLAGMLFYLKGRRIVADNPLRGYTWMSSGLIGGTVLGFLSKENAALLPLLVLTLESILLKELKAPRSFKYWKAVFLYFPSLALLLWLAYKLPGFMRMDEYRPFNLWERLMTESRALMDYLRLILIPTRTGTGVYHDDFQISRGLLDPPTTLLSIVALIGMFGAAFKFRKKLPVLYFGVAWFFVGHILESTVVPLELYFEHRNYIPMLGPLFALCYYIWTCRIRLGVFLRGSLVVFTCLAALSTWQNVYVWTDVTTNLETWEKEHPESPRLLQYATNLYAKMGEYDEAEKRLHKLINLQPEWAGPRLELIVLSCQSGKNRLDRSIDVLISELAHAEYERVSVRIVKNLLEGMQRKPCDVLTMNHIGRMIDQLLINPDYRRNGSEMGNLYSLRARYNGYLGNHRQQALDFRESYNWNGNYYIAKAESEVWAALGEYDKALEAVHKLQTNNYIALQGFRYHFDSDEINSWRKYVESMALAANQSSESTVD